MKRQWLDLTTALHGAVAMMVTTSLVAAPLATAAASDRYAYGTTRTPIKHVLIIIGENRTFDHVFATYQPKAGETVDNLLSEGIVNLDGTPGPKFKLATQYNATDNNNTLQISPGLKTPYAALPPALTDGAPQVASDANPLPFATIAAATAAEALLKDGLPVADIKLLTTGASGLPNGSIDYRIANAWAPANGPFPITSATLSYDSFMASPVHRFYQMWQEADCAVWHSTAANPSGCLNDLFPWVETTVGASKNGKPQVAEFTNQTTGEGSTSMGFYNVAKGDAPFFKTLADTYTMSDNYHQAVMGGTGANHIALGTGLAMYYSDRHGKIATPPKDEIEDPTPQPGTNNWYVQDGYSGGSYSNCSDESAPGVAQVTQYLASLPYTPSPHCREGAYYLLNNYNPGYNGDGTVNTAPFTIPPSTVSTIADRLNESGVSWRYYGAGWNAFVAAPTSDAGNVYCNICNPFLYSTQIMTDPAERKAHLKDVPDLAADIAAGTLPAVSFVKPDGLLDGHPASSKLNLFEAFSQNIVQSIQANKQLWADTAILITFDEGGGYWDSGYIQPLDFFGDGTRIPAIMVSPYSVGGHISHTYADHVSFLKFVERNWRLRPVAADSRDNYPNPIVDTHNRYVPLNSPAIGDLMDMFNFDRSHKQWSSSDQRR